MLPVSAVPGDGFNPARKHPITGKVQPHTGQDFPCPVGTQVHAVLPGKVEKTGFDPKRADGGTGAGRYLRLDHGLIDGHRITSRAYHLSAVLADGHVVAGQVVALSGNTGDSTGPHLHFEIRVDGTPVEPLAWLAAHTTTEAPEEEDDMSVGIVLIEQHRGYWLVGPGYAHQMHTEWEGKRPDGTKVGGIDRLVAAGLVKVHDYGTDWAAFDNAFAAYTQNQRPQFDPAALATEVVKALPAASGGLTAEQITEAVLAALDETTMTFVRKDTA